ncbi:MAG: hypothetical protein A3F94_00550 [Candidatus Spechtbacteria bacterium RIFCSPLOWO2_12_FULL_38_22]|uniref:CDP-diacylglycerol--glycerol-3-phosphate 3-phosphatidyltransferase n=1 Tax=Candidatus Spechtbacteria bacterium RIFCSPLOWO2_12_FULL_38_22 TaxID=1802165 RepID=A0A1G2HGC9_9BACT|nr:MAG: hypothetical protein A2728_00640 [Candidatus Spechtbacteria bacterium RIFCSPHIGHO2_01_FULL_38_11]OGZ59516.1 MAG: hypothetical protein A3E58_02475 [Candidatus Spechtbacteria bacterium RIFCSPHIGHO2_12_FULL_38_30]OGZ61429.1 MAG: hypothetical protein A3F94_00550 [Candidatus Spechtbacteria bacterium RIFCSPLOWO2_12_FULL_38_22]
MIPVQIIKRGVTLRPNRILTIPNIVTGFGILLVVVYILMYTTHTAEVLIPIIVIVIGLSDVLDGFLARALNQESELGTYIDPLRDRLMMLAIITNILWLASDINIALVVSILCAEGTVIVINAFAKYKFKLSVKVHLVGKIRALIHLASAWVFSVMLYWPNVWKNVEPTWPPVNINLLLSVMLTASILTTGVYLKRLISSLQ